MTDAKGLYIHIPFCIKKCKYCDFVSYCKKKEYFDKYIDSLLCEALEYEGTKINTVFIGGGTPTILTINQIARLTEGIGKIFDISQNAEYTVEANPKTLTEEKLFSMKKGGINRISVGVQSFCDDELKACGRIHNAEEAYKTAELVKRCGFDNFNLDLMLNLPLQTKDSLFKTLKTAVELSPSHLSCYSLILEENTPLYEEYKNGKYKEPDDEQDRKLYHFTVDFLKKYGYGRYEISNFAKEGKECAHNIKYWSCDEYIGIGTAAHSYLDGVRFYNTSDFAEYIKGNFHTDDKDLLSKKDMISEYMIMKLRMSEGINEEVFCEKFGLSLDEIYHNQLRKFVDNKLMKHENGFYFLSDYGIDVSNSVLCEFV